MWRNPCEQTLNSLLRSWDRTVLNYHIFTAKFKEVYTVVTVMKSGTIKTESEFRNHWKCWISPNFIPESMQCVQHWTQLRHMMVQLGNTWSWQNLQGSHNSPPHPQFAEVCEAASAPNPSLQRTPWNPYPLRFGVTFETFRWKHLSSIERKNLTGKSFIGWLTTWEFHTFIGWSKVSLGTLKDFHCKNDPTRVITLA